MSALKRCKLRKLQIIFFSIFFCHQNSLNMYVQSILEEEKEEIPCLLYLIQIFGLTVVAKRSNVNIRAIQILSVPRHYVPRRRSFSAKSISGPLLSVVVLFLNEYSFFMRSSIQFKNYEES